MTGCPFGGGREEREPPQRRNEWTPALEETFDSAHRDYAELRQSSPFPWSESFGGFWAATTYSDIDRITRDSDTFITSVQNVVPHVPRASRRPPLHFDPPEHTAYREAIDPVMRRRNVRRHEVAFSQSAERLVEGMIAGREPDGVRDLAAPYVMECFAAFLGISAELAQHMREIGVRYSFAIQDMDDEVIAECSMELYRIAEEIYAARLEADADPAEDLVASLEQAVQDPSTHITRKTAVATVRQMIVAGMGAPQAVIGSAVAYLALHPDLQERLRSHPEEVPVAVEELLRLHAPYRVFARTAKHDTMIRDRFVRAGEPIALIFPSANRDEEVFADPNTFVMGRRQNSHLSFGRGAHRCPAATMGRIELIIVLQTLLEKTRRFVLAGDIRMMNWLEYGPREVPLVLESRVAESAA